MNVRRMFLLILRDDFLCNGKTGMETTAKTQLQKECNNNRYSFDFLYK
jgi:hypothetical protein